MSDIIVARRYAQALYEEAEREGITEQVDADVETIRASLEASRDLVLLFQSPVISREKKSNVVEALFGERLQATTLRFLKLLIAKRREDTFPSVVQAYRELRDQQLGIVEVHTRVFAPMSESEEKSLVAKLENMTGSRVRLNTTVDTSLLGGVVVRVGDTVYDGSVRHQLATLREQMALGSFASN